MKQGIFEIISNRSLAPGVRRMELMGNTEAITAPGQFINIAVPGLALRRPISVHDVNDETVTIIFKVVGHGTDALAKMDGGSLDVLTGLGNGYDLSPAGERPVLLGGGVGIPPLYNLAKRLKAQGAEPVAILGFNTASEVFCEEEFRALGIPVIVTTVDGSYGVKGFVTDALEPVGYTYFYACGPKPMLKAVYNATKIDGQFSLEERMGCGFGACMGCSIKTKSGYKRVCKDGPVFRKEDILWED